MSNSPRKTCLKFLRIIGFSPFAKIWIRASWDHPDIPAPPNWKTYQKHTATIHCQYIFCGRIARKGKGFSLTRCAYRGRDKNGDTIWKKCAKQHNDGFAYLQKLSRAGATVSFYPNQPQDGISNNHVLRTYCLFYEIDNLPISKQHEAIEKLKLKTGLNPAAVVFTGGKSLHVYFRASTPLTPEQWLLLNRKLTALQTSDPAICNLARAMRLPGLYRRRIVDEVLTPPIPITLEQWSDCQYTPFELETSLDSTGLFPYGLSDKRWRKWVHLLRKQHNGEDVNPHSVLLQRELSPTIRPTRLLSKNKLLVVRQRQRSRNSTLPLRQQRGSAEEIPLSICLTRSDRTLLNYGSTQGSRNSSGYKLARNLIGTADALLEQGIAYYPAPLQLFRQYCRRCTPSIDEEEQNAIWRSANSKPAYASRDAASIASSIFWWRTSDRTA
jgi:hypothetical protein